MNYSIAISNLHKILVQFLRWCMSYLYSQTELQTHCSAHCVWDQNYVLIEVQKAQSLCFHILEDQPLKLHIKLRGERPRKKRTLGFLYVTRTVWGFGSCLSAHCSPRSAGERAGADPPATDSFSTWQSQVIITADVWRKERVWVWVGDLCISLCK